MVISIFTIIFLDFDKYALLILKLFGLLFYSINKNYEEKLEFINKMVQLGL